MKLLGRLSRSIRSATSSRILYGFNGKVVGFDTTKDSYLKEATGFESGDRIRSYAGNRIGQVGVVIGMRNHALFVKYNEDSELQAYHLNTIQRADLQLIDHVQINGLDPQIYNENDMYDNLQYTEKSAKLSSKLPSILDDAALQHLSREQSCAIPCQRCTENRDFDEIKTAIASLGEMQRTTQRIIRLLSLSSDIHPKLTSKDAINNAISEVLEEGKSDAYKMTVAEALSKIISDRAAVFDDVAIVEVATGRYEVPYGIVAESPTWLHLNKVSWVNSLRGIPDGAETCQKISEVSGNIQLPIRRIYDSLIKCDDQSDVSAIAGASNLHLDERQRDWYLTALQLTDKSLPTYTTLASIKQAVGVDQNNNVDEEKFYADLSKRQVLLNAQVSVRFPDETTGVIPKIALKSIGTQEVTIKDEDWCRKVVESHYSLSSKDIDELYGKTGRIQGTVRKDAIQSDNIAKGLLHVCIFFFFFFFFFLH